MYRNAKASDQLFPGGTTQNDFTFQVCKRLLKDIELRGWVQHEGWKAPLYETGAADRFTAPRPGRDQAWSAVMATDAPVNDVAEALSRISPGRPVDCTSASALPAKALRRFP